MAKLTSALLMLLVLIGCQSAGSGIEVAPGQVYRPGAAGMNPNADPYNAWMRGR